MKLQIFQSWFLGFFVLLPLFLGCGRYPKEFRAASEKVMFPPGSFWKSAQIFVGYHPGRFTRTSHISAQVIDVLRMNDGHKNQDFTLDVFSSRELDDSKDPDFVARHKASFMLQVAPDGHALALSSDGGSHWNYVALDAGSAPLYCRHLSFSVPPQGDLWNAAPTTRHLALEILKTQVDLDQQAHDDTKGHAIHEGSFTLELAGAVRFACGHPEDETLRQELTEALIRPGDQIDFGGPRRDEVTQEMADCIARYARDDQTLRERLIHRLKQPELSLHHQRGRAALALSGVPLKEVQEALSRVNFADTCPDSQVIWSLARLTSLLHTATPEVLQVLIKASEPRSCVSEISAVRGLAALKIPAAQQTLRRISSEPCSEEMPQPSQISNFKIWNEVESAYPSLTLNSACWARADLSSGAGPSDQDTILSHLALLSQDLGKNDEAVSYYQRLITLRKKVLGPTHPRVATALNNLATLYFKIGKYTESETYYKQAIEVDEKDVFDNPSELYVDLKNYAELLKSLSRFEEAKKMEEHAGKILDREMRSLGPSRPEPGN